MITEKAVLKSLTAFADPALDLDFHIFVGCCTQLHCHMDYYELLYITKGAVRYIVNDSEYLLQRGDMTFVRQQDWHQLCNGKNDEVEHVNLCVKTDCFRMIANMIDPTLLERLEKAKALPFIRLSDRELEELDDCARKINTSVAETPNASRTYMLILLCLALNAIGNKWACPDADYPIWFRNLLDQINASEFMDCNVGDIYALCHFSPPVIINTFKQYLGVSPIQYLINMKMNYACNFLKNTDFSVLSICQKLGYDSLSHFNHIFKRVKGKTPSEYRMQVRAGRSRSYFE